MWKRRSGGGGPGGRRIRDALSARPAGGGDGLSFSAEGKKGGERTEIPCPVQLHACMPPCCALCRGGRGV